LPARQNPACASAWRNNDLTHFQLITVLHCKNTVF
jgi:hypothetical protein